MDAIVTSEVSTGTSTCASSRGLVSKTALQAVRIVRAADPTPGSFERLTEFSQCQGHGAVAGVSHARDLLYRHFQISVRPPMDLLGTYLTFPLEREFEAWIVEAIEMSLTTLGINHALFAVSPTIESTWPADEAVGFFGKFIGLQIKRPSTEQLKPNDFSRLRWYLSQPSGQSLLVQKFLEIYYCLPTFVNRRGKARALDHALFWRPPNPPPFSVWYDNSHGRVQVGHAGRDAMRWGELLETVLRCQAGAPVLQGLGLSAHLRRYAQAIGEVPRRPDVPPSDDIPVPPDQGGDEAPLYLVALETR